MSTAAITIEVMILHEDIPQVRINKALKGVCVRTRMKNVKPGRTITLEVPEGRRGELAKIGTFIRR